GGPFAVRSTETRRELVELVGILERRIDQHDTTPLDRRNIGVERLPAVDRDRLGALIVTEMARERRGCVRFELAGGETVLSAHERQCQQRRAGIAADLAAR